MKKRIGRFLELLHLKKIGIKVDLYIGDRRRDLHKNWRMKMIPWLLKRRSAGGYYAIDLDSDWLGLGARIVKTLEVLLYCDENKLMPLFRYNYREQTEKDYFGELFYYKSSQAKPGRQVRFTSIRDTDELGWKEDYNGKLKMGFAGQLFEKYLGINEDILQEVQSFYEQFLQNHKVLGVHYRGTDKAGEANLVDESKLLIHIRDILKKNPDINIIFLSTDDQKIIRYISDASLGLPVRYRQDTFRSSDGDQFHRRKENSKSVVNRDAIVNCLLLSRCSILLKTASILSDCSVIFQPGIKVSVLSEPKFKKLMLWPTSEINQYALIQ